LNEFASNLSASLTNAAARYGAEESGFSALAQWLLPMCAERRPGALPLALRALEQSGVALDTVTAWQQQSLREPGFDPAVRILALASVLERTNSELAKIVDQYEGAIA